MRQLRIRTLVSSAYVLHMVWLPRPSNSHGFTVRLTVSGLISRSHGLASKSHGFPSAKLNSFPSKIEIMYSLALACTVLVPVAFYQPASWWRGSGIARIDLGQAINQCTITSYGVINLMRMRPASSLKSQGLRHKSQGFFKHFFRPQGLGVDRPWRIMLA